MLIQRTGIGPGGRRNGYQLYDANFGVFAYADMDHLSIALQTVWLGGYRSVGGISSASYSIEDWDTKLSGDALQPSGFALRPSSTSTSDVLTADPDKSRGTPSPCASPLASQATWNSFQATTQAYIAGAASSYRLANPLLYQADKATNSLDYGLCGDLSSTVLQGLLDGSSQSISESAGLILSKARSDAEWTAFRQSMQRFGAVARSLDNSPEHFAGREVRPGQIDQGADALVADLHGISRGRSCHVMAKGMKATRLRS